MREIPRRRSVDPYARDGCGIDRLCFQAAEVEQLKSRLKQYSDYDEIKRELDIMKVSAPQVPYPHASI